MNSQEISSLIENLKLYDNKKGYKLSYDKVKTKLRDTIKGLTEAGEACLDLLYPLLINTETWSCLFALEILKEIKSERSIPYLINYIRENEDGDYGESCEEAMQGLSAIGTPAVDALLNEIKSNLANRESYTYMVGAMSEIKDERVYSFMKEIVEDYIRDYKKYDDWFRIACWVLDLDKQENKEILPLLNDLLEMNHLSEQERREIQSIIDIIKDPEKFHEETDKLIDDMKNRLPEKKLSRKEYLEKASTPDEDFEANFKCKDCKERQNIKTGLIWGIRDKFLYEREIMCKHCHSNNMEITNDSVMELIGKGLRIMTGMDKGILSISEKVRVENKRMLFSKAYPYLLKRIEEEPENGGLYLRLANTATKNNQYGEAIKYYKKAAELNDKLIAAYVNLAEIYSYRYEYYKMGEVEEEAKTYFNKLVALFNTRDYDMDTISNEEYIAQAIKRSGNVLGYDVDFRKMKVGRNAPCPCGSGKKYKKCCLPGTYAR